MTLIKGHIYLNKTSTKSCNSLFIWFKEVQNNLIIFNVLLWGVTTVFLPFCYRFFTKIGTLESLPYIKSTLKILYKKQFIQNSLNKTLVWLCQDSNLSKFGIVIYYRIKLVYDSFISFELLDICRLKKPAEYEASLPYDSCPFQLPRWNYRDCRTQT